MNASLPFSLSEEPEFLHAFFARSARLWPDAIAIEAPPGEQRQARRCVTYAALKRQSDALTARLNAFVTGECVVAILLPRTSELLYCAQLAALQSGAAYVCMDPAFPDEQIREILADAEAVALLTDSEGVQRAAKVGFDPHRSIDVAALPAATAEPPALAPTPWMTPDSLAYLIYTSGTTGRPKGVMISHRSIVNLVRSDITEFGLTTQDRVAQGSSPAYDSSVEETWLALSVGGTVVAMDDDTVRLGPDLVPWLRRERITVLCPPPTLLRATSCEDPEKELPDLRLLYVGGEALPRDVADRWAQGRRLVNGYGPTECTVTSLRTDILPGQPITIGVPVPGLEAWALDETLSPVEDGTPGELCLGGVGLARGYRNLPELTEEKFPHHPELGRIYRTGDLVHRLPDGNYYYHGRIDSQVKLRGYRIELEAIESCLAQCEGVREVACRVQGQGAQETIAAFIVPADGDAPPSFEDLRAILRKTLPAYMVPGLFGLLPELPKSVGGKVRRNDLPELTTHEREQGRSLVLPRNEIEDRLAAAFGRILNIEGAFSVEDDFFNDLGGSSLLAAQLISLLRDDPSTASLAVRDLYETRTVAALAHRVVPVRPEEERAETVFETPEVNVAGATVVQLLWLLLELIVGTAVAYVSTFDLFPYLLHRINPVVLILLTPLWMCLALLFYTPFSIGIAVLTKRVLIGEYLPQRAPVWGSFYVRHWIVQQVTRLIPWYFLAGTEFHNITLRALGARIGQRVHIHRGVDLQRGGWDLLDIGDDVTLGQDASLRVVDLEARQLVVGPVFLGDGVTLETRAGVGPHTRMERNSYLTALSSLPEGGYIPAGECWDGIPAQPAGDAPVPPSLPTGQKTLSPVAHGAAMLLARVALWSALALPLELCIAAAVMKYHLHPSDITNLLFHPGHAYAAMTALAMLVCIPLPLTVALEALAVRALGTVHEGVISRWSLDYIRVWLKAGLVDSANEWLSGALFWPMWLRWAGMKVGRGCEISTIIDVTPELVEIGPDTFFADGIYLGGPQIHRGTVTLAKTQLGTNTFLGNHAVIPAGQSLPNDILLGVCTVADDRTVREGSSWFGHPPFELPRREIVECDRSLTHDPTPLRYLNRLFWESLRFALPVVPIIVFYGWLQAVSATERSLPLFEQAVMLPLLTLTFGAVPCLLILLLKWGLLGRVKPGVHPLWSCWCSRWDFLYVAWGVYARGVLTALEGTQMLVWYLRLVGMKLGKGVVLGSGFSQVVDPDMLLIEDGATVNAMFQAHTFEDRVLKIDYVRIGKDSTLSGATVPLYGAEIGEGTYVAPHSVIMKREKLLPGLHYEGAPTRARGESPLQRSETAAEYEPAHTQIEASV